MTLQNGKSYKHYNIFFVEWSVFYKKTKRLAKFFRQTPNYLLIFKELTLYERLFYADNTAFFDGNLHAVLDILQELLAQAVDNGHRNSVHPNVC